MVDHPIEGAYALALLDEVVRETDTDAEAVVVFQRKLVKPILDKFLPQYKENPGEQGYVSIQGDPIHEETDVIIREALGNRVIGENVCCKIPATEDGLRAIEVLVEQDVAINATEVFAVNQLYELCDLYEKVSRRSGKFPKLYVSHIAGIYDDHLRNYVAREKIDISPDVLHQAGLAVARKVYDIMIQRGYRCTFVGGGARGLHHFTEMVGGDVCITINWVGTADKLLETNPPVVYRIFNPVPDKVIDELMEKLPDFKKGYLDDGIKPEEYEEFGPVELFRSAFVGSWERVLKLAVERRAAGK